jgi:hypothetical protein
MPLTSLNPPSRATPTRQPGQYIIEEILDTIEKIHECTPNCNIHIEWIPGHKNIKGNEQADQAAKTAATPNNISPNIIMKSVQNRSIQSMTKAKWETEWRTGRENARRLRSMSRHYHRTATIWSTTTKKACIMYHKGTHRPLPSKRIPTSIQYN